MFKAKVHNKTRKVCLDYLKRSCNRHEMCIIDDEDNGEEIIDEKANPEAVILELEDKAEKESCAGNAPERKSCKLRNPAQDKSLWRTTGCGSEGVWNQ